YMLARRLEPLMEYIGPAGAYYTTAAEAAALLRETLRWPAARWAEAERCSVDRAYMRHGESATFGKILDDWLSITGHGYAERPMTPLRQQAQSTSTNPTMNDAFAEWQRQSAREPVSTVEVA